LHLSLSISSVKSLTPTSCSPGEFAAIRTDEHELPAAAAIRQRSEPELARAAFPRAPLAHVPEPLSSLSRHI
jgi:hypothetical protein